MKLDPEMLFKRNKFPQTRNICPLYPALPIYSLPPGGIPLLPHHISAIYINNFIQRTYVFLIMNERGLARFMLIKFLAILGFFSRVNPARAGHRHLLDRQHCRKKGKLHEILKIYPKVFHLSLR